MQKSVVSKGGLLITLLAMLFALFGLTRLSTNANYQVYFDPQDPLVIEFLQKREVFHDHDQLLIVLKSTDALKLTDKAEFHARSQALLDQLAAIDTVRQVNSFVPLLADNAEDLSSLDRLVLQERQFLSPDRRYALIALGIELNDATSAAEVIAVNRQVRDYVQQAFAEDSIDSYLSGTIGLNHAYIDTVRHDLILFIPGLLFIIIGFLWVIFRRLAIPLLLIGTGIASALFAFGIIGWLGYPLAAINAFTPVMIIGLSVVTAMHNVHGFYQQVALGDDSKLALQKSFRLNLKPLTLSCITTAVGFLFLLSSPSPPIVVTGYAAAAGIGFSYLVIISWLQAGLLYFAPSTTQAQQLVQGINLSKYRFDRKKSITIITLCLVFVAALGLSRLSINDNVYRYFPADHEFRQSLQIIDRELAGMVQADYVFTTTQGKITDRENFRQIQQFAIWLKAQHKDISNITPPVTELKPAVVELLAQNVVDDSFGLQHFLTSNQQSMRLRITLKEMSSAELLDFDRQNRHWLQQNIQQLQYYGASSADLLFAHLGARNAKSMFVSLLVALSLITLLIGVMLKSVRSMLVAFVCNFLPIILVYGLWTLWGGYITLGSAVVIGMIIGIIVDDTIHLLFKHHRFCRQTTATDALTRLWQQVTPVVFLSSVTLMLALLVGLFSNFRPIYEISFLSISVIGLALLTDMFLLPVMLQSRLFSIESDR